MLANLPYVEDGAELPPDVVRFEPRCGLFGGADGLDLVRRLIAQASSELLALEIAPEQAASVSALVAGGRVRGRRGAARPGGLRAGGGGLRGRS